MISTRIRAAGVAATTAVLLFAGAACGGGGSSSAGAEELSATLAIISTNIETAQASGSFEPATEGEQLGVGDQVKTDPTGFAEITYHDGSWQRIENNATLTIDELTQSGDTNTVRTSIDIGQSWNRVQKLTEPDDAYELDTPVATATVRGTAFATNCPTATECTFSVVDGTVVVTPTTGDPVTLTAGQQVTVTANTPPPAPTTPGVTTLSTEPFIAKNLELDTTKATTTTTKSGGSGEGASAKPADVDVCSVVTTEDAKAIASANVEHMFFPGFEIVSVDPGTPGTDGGCQWHVTVFDSFDYENSGLPEEAKSIFTKSDPNLVFTITAVDADSVKPSTCVVSGGGVCLQITGISDPSPVTSISAPADVESSIKARLGG